MARPAKNEAVSNTAAQNKQTEAPANGYPSDADMVKEGMTVLSQRIRHLKGLGASTAEITKIVRRSNGESPRYQHVRNVLNTPLKRVAE